MPNKNSFPDVDHSERFKSMVGDGPFDDYFSFEQKFEQFQKETGTAFRKSCGSTVYYENIRRKTPIPERFQYCSLLFKCTHHGHLKSRNAKNSTKRKYCACGCTAAFRLVYRKNGLFVTSFNLKHKNHPVNVERANKKEMIGVERAKLSDKTVEDVAQHHQCLKEVDSETTHEYPEQRNDKYFNAKDIANLNNKRNFNINMTQRWEQSDKIVKRVSQALRFGTMSLFNRRVKHFEEILDSMEMVDGRKSSKKHRTMNDSGFSIIASLSNSDSFLTQSNLSFTTSSEHCGSAVVDSVAEFSADLDSDDLSGEVCDKVENSDVFTVMSYGQVGSIIDNKDFVTVSSLDDLVVGQVVDNVEGIDVRVAGDIKM